MMTEEGILQIARSVDTAEDETDEELSETEEAMEDLRRVSLEGKYSFINVIVLSVVLLACAVYFISMTSAGERFSDEGIKLSPKRLVDGSLTKEITERYYGSIAYPEETGKLYEKISSFYGITGEGKRSAEKLRRENDIPSPSDNKPVTTSKKGHTENEVTTSVTTTASSGETTTVTTDPTDNSTVFSRTTTVSTSLNFDPNNPYVTITETSPTTTNNTAPPATVTSPPETAASSETGTVTCATGQTEPENGDSPEDNNAGGEP